jgi:thymidine kinase
LDQDYLGKPFEPMPQLLAVAEYITKTLAICVKCGNPADKTQRKATGDIGRQRLAERVLVGKLDLYEARCRRCFERFESKT